MWVLAGALAAVGAATAQYAVATLAVFGAIAGAIAAYVGVRGPGDLAAREARAVVPIVVGAVAGLCAVLVLAGLAVLVGATTLPIVVTVLAVALLRRLRSSGRAGADASGSRVADLRETLSTLSDGELARAWCRSHSRLAQARDGQEMERVSELRRRQLDEMERRDPVGFRRWVGSGTWVTGDSAPFLRR